MEKGFEFFESFLGELSVIQPIPRESAQGDLGGWCEDALQSKWFTELICGDLFSSELFPSLVAW